MNKGFTLIELVMTIVILAILAAAALPKFMDLEKSARIAKLRSMQGNLESIAHEWYLYAVLHGCGPTTGPGGVGTGNYTSNGITVSVAGCYPEAGVGGAQEINALVDTSGFSLSYTADTITTNFDISDAPNPSGCRVAYTQGYATNPYYTVLSTTGC